LQTFKIFYLNTVSRIEVLESFKKCFNEISGNVNLDLIEIELYTLKEQIKRFDR